MRTSDVCIYVEWKRYNDTGHWPSHHLCGGSEAGINFDKLCRLPAPCPFNVTMIR